MALGDGGRQSGGRLPAGTQLTTTNLTAALPIIAQVLSNVNTRISAAGSLPNPPPSPILPSEGESSSDLDLFGDDGGVTPTPLPSDVEASAMRMKSPTNLNLGSLPKFTSSMWSSRTSFYIINQWDPKVVTLWNSVVIKDADLAWSAIRVDEQVSGGYTSYKTVANNSGTDILVGALLDAKGYGGTLYFRRA